MSETITTAFLTILTLIAFLGSIITIPAILRRRSSSSSSSSQETASHPHRTAARLGWYTLWLCTLSSAALFVYRWLLIVQHWSPLEAHVDGLLLITTLLGLTILHVHWHWKLPAASPFGLPLVTLLLAWAVCASRWTFHPFEISSLWNALHLGTIYLGSAGVVLAALAGILLLTVTHRLRQKSIPSQISPLGNLETLERLMIRASAVGFILLSVGIISGMIILISQHINIHSQPWMTPKIILSLLLWLAYGAVINIHSYLFAIRGTKAAILSIAGLVLLLATFALAISKPSPDSPTSSPTTSHPADPVSSQSSPTSQEIH